MEPVADIFRNMDLKTMDSALLVQAITVAASDNRMDLDGIADAMGLASVLHAGQTRANRANLPRTPYIEHPLRNTLRLFRWGVRDENIIIASLLHDTVEDCADRFCKLFPQDKKPQDAQEERDALLDFIRVSYGPRVASMVLAVTNPLETTEGLTRAQKHEAYRSKVLEVANGDPDTFVVKLADFVDNATGLYHNVKGLKDDRVVNMAKKYLPLVDPLAVSVRRMKSAGSPLAQEAHSGILQQLDMTRNRLERIIAS